MSTPINRRAFLRQTASASAVAAAGVTVSTSSGGAASADLDAELVDLGAQFDTAVKVQEQASAAYHAAYEPAKSRLDEAYAMARKGGDGHAWLKEHTRLGLDPLNRAADEADEEVERIAELIRPLVPATLAGLAVRARVLRRDLRLKGRLIGEPFDWSEDQTDSFLAEVERLALAGRA